MCERGLGRSYYWSCGSSKRLSLPLKEQPQLFGRANKEQTSRGARHSPPGQGGLRSPDRKHSDRGQAEGQPARDLWDHKVSKGRASTLLRGIKNTIQEHGAGRRAMICCVYGISPFRCAGISPGQPDESPGNEGSSGLTNPSTDSSVKKQRSILVISKSKPWLLLPRPCWLRRAKRNTKIWKKNSVSSPKQASQNLASARSLSTTSVF